MMMVVAAVPVSEGKHIAKILHQPAEEAVDYGNIYDSLRGRGGDQRALLMYCLQIYIYSIY